MRKPAVYLETTVVSLLTARPTRDLIQTAWQQVTREWWDTRRARYVLYSSEIVRVEAQLGDAEAVARRMETLNRLTELEATDETKALAKHLAKALGLPAKKVLDASHIAVAAVHRMDFLLTWNCAHLANPVLEVRARAACRACGYECPVIITPLQLLEIEA